MSFLDPLLAPLQYEFMVRALATTVVAAVVCALADLFEDPSFNEGHRVLLSQLLAGGEVPQFLAERAAERLSSFASSLEELHREVMTEGPLFDEITSVEAPRLLRAV